MRTETERHFEDRHHRLFAQSSWLGRSLWLARLARRALQRRHRINVRRCADDADPPTQRSRESEACSRSLAVRPSGWVTTAWAGASCLRPPRHLLGARESHRTRQWRRFCLPELGGCVRSRSNRQRAGRTPSRWSSGSRRRRHGPPLPCSGLTPQLDNPGSSGRACRASFTAPEYPCPRSILSSHRRCAATARTKAVSSRKRLSFSAA